MENFKLISGTELTSKPYKPQWLVKNHIELESIGMLFGAPASAKSFLAMDIAFCIATGINWNGNHTVQGSVAYLAGEGHGGMGKRTKALELKYETKVSNLFFSTLPADLSSDKQSQVVFDEIQKSCKNPRLIVIDTLHRNFGNADENSAKDMSIFLHLITTMMKSSGSAVLIVHHSGHGDKTRSRGSSSIRAALDVEYSIEKKNDLVTMTCTKAKEFIEPDPLSFKLVTQSITSWLDDDGNPVESATLESTAYTSTKGTGSSLSPNDRLVLNSLTTSLEVSGIEFTKDNTDDPELLEKKFIPIEVWRTEACQQLNQKNGGANKPDSNLKAFGRAQKKLLNLGKIATEDNHYWLKAS
jgi:hypothetical protein